MWGRLWRPFWGKTVKAVENPNLPVKAKIIILGKKYCQLLEAPLINLGIDPLFVPDNPHVDPRLSGHADLSVLHTGGNRLWLAPHFKETLFAEQLYHLGFQVNFPSAKQSSVYPEDAQLNICICGKHAICNRKNVPKEIIDVIRDHDLRLIDCRQGYSKCSVCVVDREAIITADRGVELAARKAGLEVLLIEPSCIALNGFPYGFIGGASFKISEGKLAFTGTLDMHKSKNDILNFLKSRQIEPIFLTDRPIFDIGSGIPIMEK